MVFESIVKEKWVQVVEFSQVLHICFYLILFTTRIFEIYISLYTISFKLEKSTLFTVFINHNNSVILNRTTIVRIEDSGLYLYLFSYYFVIFRLKIRC